MAQFIFGAGTLWATPLVDGYGNAITNPTPIQLATSQEISIDEKAENKKLYGERMYPVDAGRGKANFSVKAKFAQVNGLVVSSIYYGQTLNQGAYMYNFEVTGQAIPTTPFQITIAPANSGTYAYDLGVRNNLGLPMTRVAASPATGQYAVNTSTGVYTFAAADVGLVVYISYSYTNTNAQLPGSRRMQIVNTQMGTAPVVQLDIFWQKNGKQFGNRIPKAIATGLQWSSKIDDYMVPEIDFECFADDAGNVMYRSFAE